MVLGLAGFEPVSVFEWTALSFERLYLSLNGLLFPLSD